MRIVEIFFQGLLHDIDHNLDAALLYDLKKILGATWSGARDSRIDARSVAAHQHEISPSIFTNLVDIDLDLFLIVEPLNGFR